VDERVLLFDLEGNEVRYDLSDILEDMIRVEYERWQEDGNDTTEEYVMDHVDDYDSFTTKFIAFVLKTAKNKEDIISYLRDKFEH